MVAQPAGELPDESDPPEDDRAEECRRSIYAAASRARSHLVVVGDPEVAEAYGFDEWATSLREAAVAGG